MKQNGAGRHAGTSKGAAKRRRRRRIQSKGCGVILQSPSMSAQRGPKQVNTYNITALAPHSRGRWSGYSKTSTFGCLGKILMVAVLFMMTGLDLVQPEKDVHDEDLHAPSNEFATRLGDKVVLEKGQGEKSFEKASEAGFEKYYEKISKKSSKKNLRKSSKRSSKKNLRKSSKRSSKEKLRKSSKNAKSPPTKSFERSSKKDVSGTARCFHSRRLHAVSTHTTRHPQQGS